MAKFPRSNRKRFQIQKSTRPRLLSCNNFCTEFECENCICATYCRYEVWGVIVENRWGILGFF